MVNEVKVSLSMTTGQISVTYTDEYSREVDLRLTTDAAKRLGKILLTLSRAKATIASEEE
jgi:hypothetical protein